MTNSYCWLVLLLLLMGAYILYTKPEGFSDCSDELCADTTLEYGPVKEHSSGCQKFVEPLENPDCQYDPICPTRVLEHRSLACNWPFAQGSDGAMCALAGDQIQIMQFG